MRVLTKFQALLLGLLLIFSVVENIDNITFPFKDKERNENFYHKLDIATLLYLSIILIKNKKMINTLEISEKQYRRMIEYSPEGIIVHINGKIVYGNASSKKLLGISSDQEIKEYSITRFLDYENLEVIKSYLHKAAQGNPKVMRFELNLIEKTGEKLIVEGTSSPIIFSNKKARELLLRDITAKKQLEQQMEYDAYFDTLTGLQNRKAFENQLSTIFHKAKEQNKTFAVMFIDLDGFKHVNDTLGHDAGDILLKEVAARLTRSVRDLDTVSRLGGDEFTILLPSIQTPEICMIAEKILTTLQTPLIVKGTMTKITSSIGIALYPDHSQDSKKLVEFADMAMYHGKKNGKNAYYFYDSLTS